MTLIELQYHLGRNLSSLMDENMDGLKKKDVFERADFVAKIAKQMINNADVILRADKLRSEAQGRQEITRLILGTDEANENQGL